MRKFFTKNCDKNVTILVNGNKVKKSSDIIELYGCLEELNAYLGFAAESICKDEIFQGQVKQIFRIQRDLFELGTQLSTGKYLVYTQKITMFESEIDFMIKELPVQESFILPGGGEAGCRLHLARAICRRAERVACRTITTINVTEVIAAYLNKLGDWLFAAARFIAFRSSIEEIVF
jgi:cob(I)alamin adenosyltransferase